MYRFGVFLEYIGGGLLVLLFGSALMEYLTGGSLAAAKEPDRTFLAIAMFAGPIALFVGWAMRKAAQAELPSSGKDGKS